MLVIGRLASRWNGKLLKKILKNFFLLSPNYCPPFWRRRSFWPDGWIWI